MTQNTDTTQAGADIYAILTTGGKIDFVGVSLLSAAYQPPDEPPVPQPLMLTWEVLA